jgi:cytochrome c nitrite reductase small subunit
MHSKWLSLITPPAAWRPAVIVLAGMLTGLGLHIIHISNAFSYLSDRPGACINCHVMRTAYASWQHGSHGRGLVCNDCHVPHDNILKKYLFKAQDGLRHAFVFTFHLEPQVIRIKQAGRRVVQANCLRCHEKQVNPIAMRHTRRIEDNPNLTDRVCWHCHRETPHGRVNSLAASFDARLPRLPAVMPVWLERLFQTVPPPQKGETP